MGCFFYFVEGAKNPTATPEFLEEHGLDSVLPADPYHSHTAGPGGDGMLLCDTARMNHDGREINAHYFPDEQTWRRVPGRKGVWCGFYNAFPPRPWELARRRQIPGWRMTLGGHEWVIPIVRGFNERDEQDGSETQLPVIMDLDKNGKWISGKVVDAYAHLQPIAQAFFDAWFPAFTRAIEDQDGSYALEVEEHDLVTWAVEMLRANYCVTAVECALLGLFVRAETAQLVLTQAVDAPEIMRWLKKKAAPEPLQAVT